MTKNQGFKSGIRTRAVLQKSTNPGRLSTRGCNPSAVFWGLPRVSKETPAGKGQRRGNGTFSRRQTGQSTPKTRDACAGFCERRFRHVAREGLTLCLQTDCSWGTGVLAPSKRCQSHTELRRAALLPGRSPGPPPASSSEGPPTRDPTNGVTRLQKPSCQSP